MFKRMVAVTMLFVIFGATIAVNAQNWWDWIYDDCAAAEQWVVDSLRAGTLPDLNGDGKTGYNDYVHWINSCDQDGPDEPEPTQEVTQEPGGEPTQSVQPTRTPRGPRANQFSTRCQTIDNAGLVLPTYEEAASRMRIEVDGVGMTARVGYDSNDHINIGSARPFTVGAEIEITDLNGMVVTYIFMGEEWYDPDVDPDEVGIIRGCRKRTNSQ